MKERQIINETTNWWQRGLAVVLFVAGLDVVAGAKTAADIIVGAGTIIASKWIWDTSKKPVPVAS